jgi:D-3-phosphoglycerate dehydrogenase
MREGKWEKKQYQGIELAGKTLGLIGFGRIAREVAKRATALGMNVIYTDIVCQADSEYCCVSFNELLEMSDFISIHCPAAPGQKPVIDTEQFKHMKTGAYLINCARGGLVNEEALLQSLNNGKIAGAGVDVFEEEPATNQALLHHPRVSVSPHIGASTVEAQHRIGKEIVEMLMHTSF